MEKKRDLVSRAQLQSCADHQVFCLSGQLPEAQLPRPPVSRRFVMRILLLADIHGNWPALAAIAESLRHEGAPDRTTQEVGSGRIKANCYGQLNYFPPGRIPRPGCFIRVCESLSTSPVC